MNIKSLIGIFKKKKEILKHFNTALDGSLKKKISYFSERFLIFFEKNVILKVDRLRNKLLFLYC